VFFTFNTITHDYSRLLMNQLQQLEQLEQLERLKKENPIFFWIPYEQQEEFLRAKNKMRMFVAANRTGKTESGIIEDISWCLGYRPYLKNSDPDFKTPMPPPVHGLITSESLGTEGTVKKVIETKLKEFIPTGILKNTKKNQQGVTVFYEFKNRSTLSVMAYEQDIEKFEGFRIHFWHGDEPPPEKLYGAISRGLVDYNGWSWITMTPVASESFTIRLFEDANNYRLGPLPIEANLKHIRKWYQAEREVGGLTQEGIDDFRRKLHDVGYDPAEIEARLTGQFKFLSGRILSFDTRVHTVEPFHINASQGTLYIAIDPHDNKPWAITFAVAHQNGNLYIVRELSIKAKLEDIVQAIKIEIDALKMKPELILIDPQAIVEESDTENIIHKIFRMSDHYLRPVKAPRGESPKSQGIQLWRAAMEHNQDKGEYPKFFIFNNCPITIRQVNGWVYDEKGKARKEDDDMCENIYRIFNAKPFYKSKIKNYAQERRIQGIGQTN